MERSKNFLFISFNNIKNANYGGAQCSIRNINVLEVFGTVTPYIVQKKSNIDSLKSALVSNFPPFSIQDEKNIELLLNQNNFDYIFYDSSLLGNLVKSLKLKYNIPSILFNHNVEVDYIRVRFGRRILGLPYKFLALINEKKSIEYSDIVIALNRRDNRRFQELYGREADAIIPITFKDTIMQKQLLSEYYELDKKVEDKTCLFVGAFGNSNFQGIKWFIQEVAPKVNVKIKVVGKGFELVKEELEQGSKNVEVLGYVEDLTKEYLEADFVISPLLFGGGMKVKIAEALMYGKTIFGTKEAFEGYDINIDRIGGLCNTADDFISKINNHLVTNNSKFNAYSRTIFEEKYSDNIAFKLFKDAIFNKN